MIINIGNKKSTVISIFSLMFCLFSIIFLLTKNQVLILNRQKAQKDDNDVVIR